MIKIHVLNYSLPDHAKEIVNSLLAELQKNSVSYTVTRDCAEDSIEIIYIEENNLSCSRGSRTFSILISNADLLNESHFCDDIGQLYYSEHPIKACIVCDENYPLTYVTTYQFNFSPLCFVHIHKKHNYSMLTEYLLKL